MQDQLILNQAIANGLDIIGDRWTILILRSAFYGAKRFDALQAATGASRSTLTRRLNTLVERKILYKQSYNKSSKRHDYLFTPRGLLLLGPSLLAAKWESDWQTSGFIAIKGRLFHKACENEMLPKVICQACQERLKYEEVAWPMIAKKISDQFSEIRTYNTQNRKRITATEKDRNNYNLATLIGDRWTLLVLIAAFLGNKQYDLFLTSLNIPSSVLAERLKQLVANGIFKRTAYQDKPPRYNYDLTEKGRTLFPFVMSLQQWVTNNLSNQHDEPQTSSPLIHSKCGEALYIDVVCDQCLQAPLPENIEYRNTIKPFEP